MVALKFSRVDSLTNPRFFKISRITKNPRFSPQKHCLEITLENHDKVLLDSLMSTRRIRRRIWAAMKAAIEILRP